MNLSHRSVQQITFSSAEGEVRRRLELRSEFRCGNFEHPGIPDFTGVPGMISLEEANYLHWLIESGYTARGEIVEVGTWLGLSTLHLADGLYRSGHKGKIHSFDRFLWGGWADNQKSGLNLEKGANFQPYFEQNIEPYKDRVEVNNVDFHSLEWSGGPIEILFLDAPKNLFGFRSCMKAFAKDLIPCETLIVFQDYLHPPSYDLALCIAELGDKVLMRHVVDYSGTVSFLLQEPLDVGDVELPGFNPRKMTLDHLRAAWDRILPPLSPEARDRFTGGLAIHLYDIGAIEEACATLQQLEFSKKMKEQWSFWSKQSDFVEKYEGLFRVFMEKNVPLTGEDTSGG